MMHLQQDNTIKLFDTEAQILKCKELDHKIKVLEAELTKTKDALKKGYFSENEIFIGSEGLVLATYKQQKRSQFQATLFKTDNPKVYEQYSIEQLIKVFLITK